MILNNEVLKYVTNTDGSTFIKIEHTVEWKKIIKEYEIELRNNNE